jgi:hypothetical protein
MTTPAAGVGHGHEDAGPEPIFNTLNVAKLCLFDVFHAATQHLPKNTQ